MKVAIRLLAGLTLVWACAAMAATMDISASFAPSMDNPENNAFTNTTPQSGFCATWPSSCSNGKKSLATGLTLTPQHGLTPQDNPRDSTFYKWPSDFREIDVINSVTGEHATVKFRVISFSGKYWASVAHGVYDWKSFTYSAYPQGGCVSSGAGWMSVGGEWVAWLWSVPEGNQGCYEITSVDRPEGSDEYIEKIDEISIGYSLIAPNPLKMSAGVYTGQTNFTVGPGGDIDFGDNFQASDSELTINFTLSVNHELKLTTREEDQKVALQPCAPGKVCTEEQGAANWERWMVNQITPYLTGRSHFYLSSSGTFTVFLQCEQQSGEDCALKSDNTGELVPVQTLLTLPDNIRDSTTGSSVAMRRLAIGKDLSRNLFTTKSFGQNQKGHIDFLVGQKTVDAMLKNRPDTYRGAVTVVFDPQIY